MHGQKNIKLYSHSENIKQHDSIKKPIVPKNIYIKDQSVSFYTKNISSLPRERMYIGYLKR